MDNPAISELQQNVMAQAKFRLSFGMLVTATISTVYFSTHHSTASTAGALALVTVYLGYCLLMLYLAKQPRFIDLRDMVVLTAVLDPLFLSAWLIFAGETAVIFVAFYLFSVLGYGFRLGAKAMHICQVISLIGFTAVAFISPVWQEQLLFAISNVLMLVVVPVYASFLIKRIQAAKALAENESHAKSQLLAKVSHELRTPLTGIMASAQLVEAETAEAGTVKRMKSIQQMGNALETEISQLLELSKLSTQGGKQLEAATSFSLAYAATQSYKSLEAIAAGKNLAVALEFDPDIRMPVIGHPQQLLAVLTNLAGNAVKFTESGSVVLKVRLVEASPIAYRVWIGVEDTGIGVAPEHHEKIFEPFFQVADNRTGIKRGTGLGSTIAKELVRAMGGELRLSSDVGKGSVFWFELDLPIDQQAIEHAPDAPRAPAGKVVSDKRVLIADDNVTNLELMREMLLQDGHEVVAVNSGEQAIRHLSGAPFDIVFLDYNIDDIDGATVFQTYQFSRVNTAPTFFVTADTTARTTQLLDDLGATGVLYKPMTFHKIRDAFSRAFPGEGVVAEDAQVRVLRIKPVELAGVPVEYIDMAEIEMLREIRNKPDFLYKMLGDALSDIAKLESEIEDAIGTTNLPLLHRAAHSLKGVTLSVGCMRLAALADRMMGMTHDSLVADAARWQSDLRITLKPTVDALHGVRQEYAPPHAVNT